MRRAFLLALILQVMIFNYLFSQEISNPSNNPIIEFINNEKIRIRAKEAVERYQHPEKYTNKNNSNIETYQFQSSNDEIIVSQRKIPESEIFSAINPKNPNNIVISPIKQDMGHQTDLVTCPVYYTFDGGKTWGLSDFITKPYTENISLMGGGDPVLVFDNDGNLYFTWINLYVTFNNSKPDSIKAAIFWAKSSDGGKTFQFNENNVFDKIFSFVYSENPQITQMLDKQWMACDRSNSKWQNTLYLSCLHLNQSGFLPQLQLRIYRKTPNSDTFESKPAVINTKNIFVVQFGSIDVDRKGYVHYVFYGTNGMTQELYHSVSKDGGLTFSDPKKISQLIGSMRQLSGTENVIGISAQRMYPSPYMAVDKGTDVNSDNIYVTWTANGISSKLDKGLDIYFSRSTDGGETWANPIVVNQDNLTGVHNFYSNIAVNDSGVIAITYYDRRNYVDADPQQALTDLYLSTSFDGGLTFNDIKVNSESSMFGKIGTLNNEFGIGEYNSVLIDDDYIYPVWADGRTNDGNINVYMAKIKIDKTQTSIDEIKPISNYLNINSISPNPAKEQINIEYNSEFQHNVLIEIIDILGNSIINFDNQIANVGTNQILINTNTLVNGTYFVKISYNNIYTIKQFKIIK